MNKRIIIIVNFLATCLCTLTAKPNSDIINGFEVKWAPEITPTEKETVKTILNDMVFVEGGQFIMGSDEGGFEDACPSHPETVNSFWIDKFELTQKLWKGIMGNPKNYLQKEGDNLPISNITLHDCRDFIKRLNELSGLNFRLPSEAEWEYAARGGNKAKNDYLYSGSDNPSDVAWFSGNSTRFGRDTGPQPVGSLKPNDLGLYDMSGNVYEWTFSKKSEGYGKYTHSKNHAIRGGCWEEGGDYVRVISRNACSPRNSFQFLGLRLALSSNKPVPEVTYHISTLATQEQREILGRIIDNLVYVDGGELLFGGTNSLFFGLEYEKSHIFPPEETLQKKQISPFRIGKFEITQREWEAIMGENPSEFKGDLRPVESVSIVKVKEFIDKINNLTGLNFRLPTPAEWEFASKGGNLSKDYFYSGSNNPEEVAWISYKSNFNAGKTSDVGQKLPNELGLYDMTGNVCEWLSWDADLPIEDPEYIFNVRGGSYDHIPLFSPVQELIGFPLPRDYCEPRIGFRLALDM